MIRNCALPCRLFLLSMPLCQHHRMQVVGSCNHCRHWQTIVALVSAFSPKCVWQTILLAVAMVSFCVECCMWWAAPNINVLRVMWWVIEYLDNATAGSQEAGGYLETSLLPLTMSSAGWMPGSASKKAKTTALQLLKVWWHLLMVLERLDYLTLDNCPIFLTC